MSAYYECECDNFDMTEGQDSFEMNEGIPGPGVPAGGSAGQVLRKTTSADYDTEWDTLTAGDVAFNKESGYVSGTVGRYLQLLDSEDVQYTYGGEKELGTVGETLDYLADKSVEIEEALGNKVDKVSGKGLSKNDFTDALKTKLEGIEAEANKTVIDTTLATTGQAADAKATGDAVSMLRNTLSLLDDEIPDTVQTITFDQNGNVQSITHSRNNVAVRTDVFTFAANSVTEVRTLSTGQSLTIVTNLSTLETTITYSEGGN